MIQCVDCEFYESGPDGGRAFKCDPFVNIKEPECLTKWQLLRLEVLVSGYRGMVSQQQKLAPMQDKMMKYIERELSDLDEADQWKLDDDVEDDQPEEEGPEFDV
jgi:hypothetical protein